MASPPATPHRQGSWPPWARGNQLLASDADREQVVVELTEHHVEGRINSDEFRERTRLAYGARTSGELTELLSDLPDKSSGSLVAWNGLRSLRLAGPFPGLGYAGFWPRAGALWADLLLLAGGSIAVHALISGAVAAGLIAVLPLVYFVGLWATTGRTFGLWLVGARVVRQEDGRRLGFRRSLIRLVGYAANLASCSVGFVWAGVDWRKQGWHDKMAGSYVVRRLS
ncbi:MAG: RDD family protein [Candidatus Dormiibacterota bacterium]